MPQCRWHDPELSTGLPHTSLDLLGRYKCWSLKDKSPAHLKWKIISKDIVCLLGDQFEHLDAGDSDLMVEMFMIGRKPKSSIPTILFSCESKACRQKAMELVQKKGLLADSPGVLMAECSRLPRLLALEEKSEFLTLAPGVYVTTPLQSYGTPVIIRSELSKLPRRATIGGFVSIEDEIFGVTTAHAFSAVKEQNKNAGDDLVFAFYGIDNPYDSSDSEQELANTTSQASISSKSSQSPSSDGQGNDTQQHMVSSQDAMDIEATPAENESVSGSRGSEVQMKVGNIFASSTINNRLDWALVKIESSTSSPFYDFRLPGRIVWENRVIYPDTIKTPSDDAHVLICTGSNGLVEGELSSVSSFVTSNTNHGFQQLLVVRRMVGNFSDGDCGSWIFDRQTGDVYGHIVSGYPETGTAYVVPSVQIFQDIQRHVGKLVKLFTPGAETSYIQASTELPLSPLGRNPNSALENNNRGLQAAISAETLLRHSYYRTETYGQEYSGSLTSTGLSARRPRASKPKVKSGCITCKARRVKCDETKPHCLRCQKFGRLCDGYLPEPFQTRGPIQVQPIIPSLGLFFDNAIHKTEDESRYFQIFSEQTAYELSGYFDSTLWTRIILRESHQMPAIRYSVIALGALSKSLETAPAPGLRVNVIQALSPRHIEQAALFHLKAIQELTNYISSSNKPQLRYALICNLSFLCFEVFQQDYASSVQQTYSGLKILRSYYVGLPGSRPWIPRHSILPESPIESPEAYDEAFSTISQRLQERLKTEDPLKSIFGERTTILSATSEAAPPSSTSNNTVEVQLQDDAPVGYHADNINFDTEQQWTMDMYSSDKSLGGQSHSFSYSPGPFPKSEIFTRKASFSSTTSDYSATFTGATHTTPSSAQGSCPPSPNPSNSQKGSFASRSSSPPVEYLYNDLILEEILIRSFVRVNGLELFFGMTPEISPLRWDIHHLWHLPIPSTFTDYLSAQRCWDFLMERCLQFYCQTLFDRAYKPSTADLPTKIARDYAYYTGQISAFEHAFQYILEDSVSVIHSPDGNENITVLNPAALVLSLYIKATSILLSAIVPEFEMAYDKHLCCFKYIIRTCSLLIPLDLPRNKRFSFEVGIIPPLHLTATKCRDPIVRRKAIDLLFCSPRQEGTWDGVLCARIGRWVMQCEEEGLPLPPVTSRLLRPSNSDPAKGKGPQMLPDSNLCSSPIHTLGSQSDKMDLDTEMDFVGNTQNLDYIDNGFNFKSDSSSSHLRTSRSFPLTSISTSASTITSDPGSKGNDNRTARNDELLNKTEIIGRIEQVRTSASPVWTVPEKNRVQLIKLDYHIPDRHIRLKCQKVCLDSNQTRVERETIISW